MKKLVHRIVLTISLVCLSVAAAVAAPAVRIHEIRRPLLNIPAIVKAGGAFEITLQSGGKMPGAVALFQTGHSDNMISLNTVEKQTGDEVFLSATVPSGAHEALYDLTVSFSDGTSDTQPHAVKVVSEFKNEFIFVHLTDIHFNANYGMPYNTNDIRMYILDQITALHPEFVVMSGDIGMNPKDYGRDYPFGYEAFRDRLPVPIFMTPGNHELYIDDVNGEVIDGLDYWTTTYGPTYNSFDYGNMHVASINSFEWPAEWRDQRNAESAALKIDDFGLIGPGQFEWLQADFKAARDAGRHIIAHTHIPLELLQGGRKIGLANPVKMDGPSLQKFIKFLNYYEVSHVFVGHLHYNGTQELGDPTLEILTQGAGNTTRKDDLKFGFRVIHVKDGIITDMETREYGIEDINKTSSE